MMEAAARGKFLIATTTFPHIASASMEWFHMFTHMDSTALASSIYRVFIAGHELIHNLCTHIYDHTKSVMSIIGQAPSDLPLP